MNDNLYSKMLESLMSNRNIYRIGIKIKYNFDR